jgi:hypothetical protein
MRHRWQFSTFETVWNLCRSEVCSKCRAIRKSRGRSWRHLVVVSVVPGPPQEVRRAWRRGPDPCPGVRPNVDPAEGPVQTGLDLSTQASDR